MDDIKLYQANNNSWKAGVDTCDVKDCFCREPVDEDFWCISKHEYRNILRNLGGKIKLASFEDVDPNGDCNVCHNGGSLLCCDRCPRVYHLECYIPALVEEPGDNWTCLMCTTKRELRNIPNEKGKLSGNLTELEMHICKRLLFYRYSCWPESSSFLSTKALNFPMYRKKIKKPIALDLITKRLIIHNNNARQYQSIFKFRKDVKHMFKNCNIFWGGFDNGNDYGKHAQTLEPFFDKNWTNLVHLSHIHVSKSQANSLSKRRHSDIKSKKILKPVKCSNSTTTPTRLVRRTPRMISKPKRGTMTTLTSDHRSGKINSFQCDLHNASNLAPTVLDQNIGNDKQNGKTEHHNISIKASKQTVKILRICSDSMFQADAT